MSGWDSELDMYEPEEMDESPYRCVTHGCREYATRQESETGYTFCEIHYQDRHRGELYGSSYGVDL